MATPPTFSEFYKENKALLKEYLDARLDLIKLQGIRIISRSFSLLAVVFLAGFFLMFVVLFLGLAFSAWITRLSDNPIVGYASGAGLFLVLLLLIVAFRRPLFQKPLMKAFIEESMEHVEDEIL